MKKTFLFFFFLFSARLLLAQTANSVILLLNIGQSNVVGRAQPDGANEVGPTTGTWWYKQSTNTLEPLVDGIGEGISRATERSMNPMLGKRIKELTGNDVIIVPAGCGNTFLQAWTKEDNSLYTRAKSMWQAALAYCQANNITVAAKYAHWLQGENDAGVTEVDGYYVMLDGLVNDLVSDVGVERVFGTRIGYDPNYTAAANSEKIMKAQKLVAFNNSKFIAASYAPPTFTYNNGKMAWDMTHHTLLGLNEEANDIALAIQHYRTTGAKIQLTENVASLQAVTNGYINLSKNWLFPFDADIAEASGNVLTKQVSRNGTPIQAPGFVDDGLVLTPGTGLAFSRPFSSATFTIEVRLRMTKVAAWTTVLGRGDGNNHNKLTLAHDNNTSALYVQFGTADGVHAWDLGNTVNLSTYHTIKIEQAAGTLKLFVDGVQRGDTKTSTSPFTASLIGMGSPTLSSDMDGVIAHLRLSDAVSGAPLPVKFKSFKATNVK